MLIFLLLFLGLLERSYAQEIGTIAVNDPKNITIAFGSCFNTFEGTAKMNKVLQSILHTRSDIWMWLGDAVYLDGDAIFLGGLPGPEYDIADEFYARSIFNILKENPVYVELRNNVSVIGVWDDHDYAYDNKDKTFAYKQRNIDIYLDFIDEPTNSSRRSQQGIYRSYYVGDDRLVKIILLDVRYNLDPQSDDMLGEEQWLWLDNELVDQSAVYTIIASGTQHIPDDRLVLPHWYIKSRERLFDMIKAHKKSGVVLLSGDVHYAEMLKHPCPGRVGYKNFYEFTSSGLTHSASFADFFSVLIPDTYSREEDRYFEKNFGLLRFIQQENSAEPPNLVFEARDVDGNVVLTREVLYSDLVYDEILASNYHCDVADILDVSNDPIF